MPSFFPPARFRQFRENALFRGDPSRSDTNACVGWNGGPYDLFAYADGYFQAAILLIERVHHGGVTVDTLVYPICFSFRHAIELSVKAFADALAQLEGQEGGYELGHNLLTNWQTVRSRAQTLPDLFEADDITLLDDTITHICDVDSNGQIFRYPESHRRDMHLEDRSLINLSLLGERVLQVYELAKSWDGLLAIVLENRRRNRAPR